jgi:hypothetical protein
LGADKALAKEKFDAKACDFVEIGSSHDGVPRVFIVRADCLPQIEEHWLVVQPEVVSENPTQGWEPVDEVGVAIESGDQGIFRLQPGDANVICMVRALDADTVEVVNMSQKPLALIAWG